VPEFARADHVASAPMKCPRCAARVSIGARDCEECGAEFIPTERTLASRFDAGRPRSFISQFGAAVGVAALLGVMLWAVEPVRGRGRDNPLAIVLPTNETTATTALDPDSSLADVGTTVAPASTVAPTTGAPTTPAPKPPGPLTVASAAASCTARNSTDSRGNPVSFAASNIIDGDNTTAWRCPGTGRGVTLTFSFAKPIEVTSIASIPGYDRVDPFNGDDRFTQNRRVKTMKWVCVNAAGKDLASVTQEFADNRASQPVATPKFVGCLTIRAEIVAATATAFRDNVAVSEVAIAGRA
jgi:hypothetical protein